MARGLVNTPDCEYITIRTQSSQPDTHSSC